MDGNTLEVYGASNSICLCIVGGKAEAVGDFRVELNVIVKNGPGFVEAGWELMIAIAINIGDDGYRTGNVGIAIAVNIVSINERGILNQVSGWRRSDSGETCGSAER